MPSAKRSGATGLEMFNLRGRSLSLPSNLDPEDLKQIRPHLTLNPGQPDRNQVGRYGSVAVFPFDARGMASLHCIFFDGVYFEYVPMDVVD